MKYLTLADPIPLVFKVNVRAVGWGRGGGGLGAGGVGAAQVHAGKTCKEAPLTFSTRLRAVENTDEYRKKK